MSGPRNNPPHQPAAVPAPLAGAPPSHQPGRAAAGLSCLEPGLWAWLERNFSAVAEAAKEAPMVKKELDALAEAKAQAEHWAAQADRLAGQVEAMRAVMLEVAEKLEWDALDEESQVALAERLRRAAGGEGGE